MLLETSSLDRAIAALQRSLSVHKQSLHNNSAPDLVETVQGGVIQSFEFSYELCWKFMKRWLEGNLSPASTDGISRRGLFRLAAENQLITDTERWMEYHEARNETSHTYNPITADQVATVAIRFYEDASKFIVELNKRNQ